MQVVLSQPLSRSEQIGENFRHLLDAAKRQEAVLEDADVLVLPELVGATSARAQYYDYIANLAQRLNCIVVGGSHHDQRGRTTVNCGLVVNPSGDVVVQYEKLRPYGSEIHHGITGGDGPCFFRLYDRNVCVLICSDLWFSSIFASLPELPELIICPSCSITQRSSPDTPQNLWKHMAVARAYEYAAYVGVSDWAHPCEYGGLKCCGTSGIADPWPRSSDYFLPVGKSVYSSYTLDFNRLHMLRGNRIARGFLWESTA